MDGKSLYWFIHYLMNNVTAQGAKRVVMALVNILLVGLAGGCIYGIVTLAGSMPLGVIVSIILIIVLVVIALYLVLNGVIGQIALMIMSLIGCFADKEHRASAIFAFVIALLSLAAAGVALWLLLG